MKMLLDQNARCKICDRELVLFSGNKSEAPCVDHKHRNDGERCTPADVRGLLCHVCNIAVGFIEKDPYRTYAVFHYLADDAPSVDTPEMEKLKRQLVTARTAGRLNRQPDAKPKTKSKDARRLELQEVAEKLDRLLLTGLWEGGKL